MRFAVQFNQSEQKLSVQFKGGDESFSAGFKDIQFVSVTPEAYTGDYSIVPAVYPQLIQTARKMMRDDLTVNAIPTYNVANASGGSTFYIATTDDIKIAEG